MSKRILVAATLPAFLAGCGGNGSGAATPAPPPALQLQLNEIKPQTAANTDLITGERVYRSTCSICHKSGMSGAPRIGSKEDWEPRLAQGKEILYNRAIRGYRGEKGSMPSRGSNVRLSDSEVRAAVDYMVTHAVPAWSWGDK